MWPDRRIIDLFGVELPIIVAPMANFAGLDLAVAVAEAGGLGSLPCAVLDPRQDQQRSRRVQVAHAETGEPQFLLPWRGAGRP